MNAIREHLLYAISPADEVLNLELRLAHARAAHFTDPDSYTNAQRSQCAHILAYSDDIDDQRRAHDWEDIRENWEEAEREEHIMDKWLIGIGSALIAGLAGLGVGSAIF